MHVLVSGANGFLGSHLVEHLLQAGHEVTALVRPGADLRWLTEPSPALAIRRARFDDPDGLRAASEPAEVVCHVAGATRARPEAAYHSINVGTTRALLDACLAAGTTRRFVLCSSLSAGGPPPPGQPKREDQPGAPRSRYGQSKREAERVAFARRGDLEVVALRPGPIYGPRDTYSLELLRLARHGVHVRVGPRGACYNFCHVQDVVAAFERACHADGVDGEALYVGDRTNYPAEIFEAAAADAVGVAPRLRLHLPRFVVTAAAAIAESLTPASAPVPALNRDKARDLVAGCWALDSSRAQRRLGWSPQVELRNGLASTAAWYRQVGWL